MNDFPRLRAQPQSLRKGLTMRKLMMAAAAASCVFAAPAFAQDSQTLAVSATVAEACTFTSAGTLNFGNVLGTGEVDGTGAIGIECNGENDFTFTATLGANPDGSQRRMANGTGDFLAYDLYLDDNREFPLTATGVLLTRDETATSLPIYGRIPALASGLRPVGAFTDNVTLTISY